MISSRCYGILDPAGARAYIARMTTLVAAQNFRRRATLARAGI
jgi:hypothetical protein